MIRRVAVPALQLDPGVSLNPRSAAPSYDFADPLVAAPPPCAHHQAHGGGNQPRWTKPSAPITGAAASFLREANPNQRKVSFPCLSWPE